MKRPLVPVMAALAIAAATALPGAAAPAPPRPAAVDSTYALVQLTGSPISTAAETRPQNGGKIDLASSAVRSRRAVLAAERNAFRQWLRQNAPGARVTGEFDLAVNAVGVQLNGTSLDTLRNAPRVRFVEEQSVFRPIADVDPDLSLSDVKEAWQRIGGPANAGKGVDVAIIDSGIDITHPCFHDEGYGDVAPVGDRSLTNNKVFVARVYGNTVAKDGFDASDQNGHGTHVAGTVACNAHTVDANVAGAAIPYAPSGVAPAARLGNYNVFPGTSGSARSEDILEALEDAYEDGFDVANMSLGGARTSGGFLVVNAVDNMDRANMVVAVAAGNEGPGYFTVHYPGAAERALTAGASTVGHGVVNTVTVGTHEYDAVVAEFTTLEADVTAPLQPVAATSAPLAHGLSTACDTDPLPQLAGTIALLGRGACDFTTKVRNAKNAGAVGVIVVNQHADPPFVMGHNGLEPAPTIPAVMVSRSDGTVLVTEAGQAATIDALGVYRTYPESIHMIAGFSSQGPTHGDARIKPDVVAPGADVLSAQPAWACDVPPCWAFFGGTSMATPHLAGAAAVVRAAHPGWTAEQVRSAVVNTAQQGLLRHPDTGEQTDDPLIMGAGLLDVANAVGASAGLSPVSTSFGTRPSGAGGSRTATVTVTNLSEGERAYTAIVDDALDDGVTFTTSAGQFVLAAGASTTVSVTVTSAKGAQDGHAWATLRVTSGGTEVAHGMLYTLVGEGVAAPGRHQVPLPFA